MDLFGRGRRSWKARRLVACGACAVAALLTAVGCADEGIGPNAVQPTPKRTVVLADDAYHPRVVHIPVDARVTWVNRNVYPATVETAGVAFFEYDSEKLDAENRFDLHTVSPGEAMSVVFDTPGRYDYQSSFDSDMTGTVVVRAAPASAGAPDEPRR